VDGSIPERRSDRDLVQRHAVIVREYSPELYSCRRQRLEGDDPGVWHALSCNKGKLPTIRANVDHRAAIETGKNPRMLHPGRDTVA
jgi:hypothetical protein